MQWLKDFVNSFFGWMLQLLEWALDGIVYLVKLVAFWFYDGFLTIVTVFIQAIDFSVTTFSSAAYWANVPTQLIYIVNSVGLPQCFTIIFTAMLIRVTLNLIPGAFTRV